MHSRPGSAPLVLADKDERCFLVLTFDRELKTG